MRKSGGRVVQVVVVFGLDIGNACEVEKRREHENENAYRYVRNVEGFASGAAAVCVLRVEEHAADDGAENLAKAIELLREINSRLRIATVADLGRVRVRDR